MLVAQKIQAGEAVEFTPDSGAIVNCVWSEEDRAFFVLLGVPSEAEKARAALALG